MAYIPPNPNGQAVMASSAPVVIASNQSAVPIGLPNNNKDVYNQVITAERNLQLSLSFFALTPAAQLTITGTGSTSQSGGEGVFSSGVGVTNTLKAVSPLTLIYAPGFELYSSFSARFTVGTVTSVQRLGPYNATDGFSFGYNNTAFGLWSRLNTVDTLVAQSSWNLDPCLAAATSKFTRNGVPEALDPTKTNIYRVRYGWHGAAAVFYEILAPDGDYVQVHVLRIANSLTTPSMISPNVPITLDIIKTAGATDIIMRCAAWSGGTTAPAAVKSPSTIAAAADPALVVAISPNSPAIPASTLVVTVTAAANTGATLTLPAAGAGLFHYITNIQINRTATAALAGTATLVATTSNLPGSLAFSFGNAMVAGGTQRDLDLQLSSPLKSSAANTNTTVVMPIPGAAVLWRANVFYYTGP